LRSLLEVRHVLLQLMRREVDVGRDLSRGITFIK
jgi:hypothetical protein